MNITANPPMAPGTNSGNRSGTLAHGARSGAKLIELPRPQVSLAKLLAALRRRFEKLRREIGNRLCRQPKRLFVSQTAALGERRSVAVIQFERQRFLIGCGPSSVALLAHLPDADTGEATASVPSAEQRTPGGPE
jgi:hypothetical protein